MKAKAYGKILLFGAYSILEPGNLGYVVTINKGTTTDVKETDSGKLIIDLTNFQISITGNFKNNILRLNKNHLELNYIKNAIDYSFKYLVYNNVKIKDIKLTSVNDPELSVKNQKTGLGSSASAVVSTVSAILALHDINDKNIVFKISRYAHFKAQNNLGSGYDIAAACYGSHFFISDKINPNIDFLDYIKQTDNYIKREFDFSFSLLPVLIFVNRQVSTQEFIKKAIDYKNKKPKEYESFMYEYNQINNNARYALETNNLKKLKFYLEESWEKRKKFGIIANINIETNKETDFINDLKQKGAYTAGIIGAGGDSILALCSSKEDKKNLMNFLDEKNYTYLDVKFGNKGYVFL